MPRCCRSRSTCKDLVLEVERMFEDHAQPVLCKAAAATCRAGAPC